jgi:hypothetical protein
MSPAGFPPAAEARAVAMTSDVKSSLAIFYVIIFIAAQLVIGRGGASPKRRLILLLSVGWVPPDWRPSGAGLARGTRVSCSRFTPCTVLPAAVQDSNPLEGQRAQSGLVRGALRALLLIRIAWPSRSAGWTGRPTPRTSGATTWGSVDASAPSTCCHCAQ